MASTATCVCVRGPAAARERTYTGIYMAGTDQLRGGGVPYLLTSRSPHSDRRQLTQGSLAWYYAGQGFDDGPRRHFGLCVAGTEPTGTGDVVDHGDRMETPGVVRAVARFQFEWRAARCFIRVVAVAQAELESAAVLAIVCWGYL